MRNEMIAEDIPVEDMEVDTPELLKKCSTKYAGWSIILWVPRLDQCHPIWGADIMKVCNSSICISGCLLTSSTMVFQYYGSDLNPRWVNVEMGDNACPWKFTYKSGIARASRYKAKFDAIYGFSYGTMLWALQNDIPVVLEFGHNDHWVVVQAVISKDEKLDDTKFYVIDPLGGVGKRLSHYSHLPKGRIALYKRR